MNDYRVTGNISWKGDFKQTEGKISTIKFGIASNYQGKTKDGTYETRADFIYITAFGTSANLLNKLPIGTKILVAGVVKPQTFEINGKKSYSNEIIVKNIETLSPKKGETKVEHLVKELADVSIPTISKSDIDDDISFDF